MIIDEVDSKSPFLSGIFVNGKRFSKLIISYVVRIYMNKGENIPAFLYEYDVIEYIN